MLATKEWRKLVGRAVASIQILLEEAQSKCEALKKENAELREVIMELTSFIKMLQQEAQKK